jgi:uncharacterized protein (DUF4415 family)
MIAKPIDAERSKLVSFDSLDDMPPLQPIGEAARNMSDEEIDRRVAADPDAGVTPAGFWDDAVVIEPDTTEQVTLRLPRRVLRHFRAGGKGYQSRISAVLASYVDAMSKRTG